MIPRTVAALCISHTSPAWNQTTLPPFALWPAFPASDYYGGSVAVGLAPRRRSRFPDALDVAARRRRPVRLLEWARSPPPIRRKIRATCGAAPYPDGPAPSVVVGGCS